MRALCTFFLLLFVHLAHAQDVHENSRASFAFNPELMLGYTVEANGNFPDRGLQWQVLANFGWDHEHSSKEWVSRLGKPRTGITLGYTNLSNPDELGNAITIMPYLEFDAFGSDHFRILVGMGGSYFDTIYDIEENPDNQGITTRLVWSFRSFLHYRFHQGERLDWRAGIGYYHHSNGHTRLPNQGLNSFLVSLSADFHAPGDPRQGNGPELRENRQAYLSIRSGLGVNVLAKPDPFNDKKPVYTLAGEYGRIYNRTWKIGLGFYYRYYQHYFDYIEGNESLVQDGREFDDLRSNPSWNAAALGVYGSGEVLLGHVGVEVELGFNIHKPAYRIDWRINQGWSVVPREIPAEADYIVLGEFNTKFRLKHLIASRMGLKYYLWNTEKNPRSNLFVGAHINANGGQADFTDISLGYVYRFKSRTR